MHKEKLVPELRFSEFEGSWSSGHLSDLIDGLDAGVSVNSENKPANEKEKGILKTSCVTNGLFDPTENKVVVQQDEIVRLKESVKAQTIIISRMNTPALVGANAYVGSDFPDLFLPDRLWAAKINKQHFPEWVGMLLAHSKTRAVFSARGTGTSGSMKNITKGDVLTAPSCYPSSKEQQKIANFLTAIDQRITLLKQKKAALAQYKKGLMQKIFNQEIRFKAHGSASAASAGRAGAAKDEEGNDFPDWENTIFSKVCKFYSGGTPRSSNKKFYNGNIPFIKSGEISKTKTEQFLSEDGLSSSSAKIVNKNDLLLAIYGATSGEVAISRLTGAINQAVLCIQTNQNKKYLLNYLKLYKEKFLAIYLQGGQGNLSAQIVGKFPLKLPILKEQQKIADCLSAIDQSINQLSKQIEQSNQFKKGLLQRMFV